MQAMGAYVLVVESDPDLQRRIGDSLRDRRFEIAAETEVSWAKRSIAVRPPDVVVLDTQLSDGPGFSLADELRRDPDTQSTPILFIASRRFRGAAHRSEILRRYAPASYLVAPAELIELSRRLDAIVPGGEANDATVVNARAPSGFGDTPADARGIPAPQGTARARTPSAGIEDTDVTATGAPPPTEVPMTPSARELALRVDAALAAVEELPEHAAPAMVISEESQPTEPLVVPPPVMPDPAQIREKRDVERTARSLEHADADLRGSLKRTPFARLLQRLFARRATGSLLLMRGTTKKIVSFADGYPVSVRSNVLGECLGQILVKERLISNEALQESLRRMKAEKRHQGEILVEMGVLSPYNLSRALIEQVEAKLFEIFAWPDGQYMFKQGEPPPREALRLERSPAAMILEGVRRHYDINRQEAALHPFVGKYVAASADPVMRLQEVTSNPTEQAFVREIDGRAKLETVLGSARIPRHEARLLLVALSQAGMIEPSELPVRRSGTPTPTDPVLIGIGPLAPAAVPDTSDPLSSAQLALVAQTVRAQNHYWALGVQPGDPPEMVDQAYESLARSFHPDRYRQRNEDDRRLAQEIFDRLAEAHRVLRDPSRRRSYAAKLEKRPAEPLSGPIPAGAAREIYEVGMRHLRANRHHEAVEAFRQAARMVPDQADFRAALGWALFREAPTDARAGRAAQAELRRAIQLDPKSRRGHYYLGHFFAQTGQPDLAIAEFEKLLELDPGAAEVADELRRLRESR